ncbi:hypothetical protein MYC06_004592 [Vibrio parahaemolyticus]|nr:hypothetical protein [Vibrio parahaemolyticus]
MELKRFLALKSEKIAEAQKQEENGSKAMAYIAMWSVVEKTLSELESERLESKLKLELKKWTDFLVDKVGKPPQPIKGFKFKTDKLPNPNGVQVLLGDAPAICKLVQTQAKGKSSKYRDKRNAIAHSAEEFKDLSTFNEYKNAVMSAIEELEHKLREKG